MNDKARLVVISYHSLEDKLIKNLITKGNVDGIDENDFFGNRKLQLTPINKKVIVPTDSECNVNSRARSAKLRIAEKSSMKQKKSKISFLSILKGDFFLKSTTPNIFLFYC